MSEDADRKRKRYAEDPEYRKRVLAAANAYRKRNKKSINAKRRLRWATDPDLRRSSRASALKSLYGITLREYDALVAKQKGRCAICREKPRLGRLHVDHCHRTNVVRWLLCNSCNVGIGCFRDNPRLLRAAAAGLERARKRKPRPPTKPARKKRR